MNKGRLLFFACTMATATISNTVATPPPRQANAEDLGEEVPLFIRAKNHVITNKRTYSGATAAAGLLSLLDMLRKRRNHKNYFQNEYGNQFAERLLNFEPRAWKALLRGLTTAGAIGFGGYHLLKSGKKPDTASTGAVQQATKTDYEAVKNALWASKNRELHEQMAFLPKIADISTADREAWAAEREALRAAQRAAQPAIKRAAQREQKAREVYETAFDVRDPEALAARIDEGLRTEFEATRARIDELAKAGADAHPFAWPERVAGEGDAEYNARADAALAEHYREHPNAKEYADAVAKQGDLIARSKLKRTPVQIEGEDEAVAADASLTRLADLRAAHARDRQWERLAELETLESELAVLQNERVQAANDHARQEKVRAITKKEGEIATLMRSMPARARALRALDQYDSSLARLGALESIAPDPNYFAPARASVARQLRASAAGEVTPAFTHFVEGQTTSPAIESETDRMKAKKQQLEESTRSAQKAQKKELQTLQKAKYDQNTPQETIEAQLQGLRVRYEALDKADKKAANALLEEIKTQENALMALNTWRQMGAVIKRNEERRKRLVAALRHPVEAATDLD